jgi:hypothetical protein
MGLQIRPKFSVGIESNISLYCYRYPRPFPRVQPGTGHGARAHELSTSRAAPRVLCLVLTSHTHPARLQLARRRSPLSSNLHRSPRACRAEAKTIPWDPLRAAPRRAVASLETKIHVPIACPRPCRPVRFLLPCMHQPGTLPPCLRLPVI